MTQTAETTTAHDVAYWAADPYNTAWTATPSEMDGILSELSTLKNLVSDYDICEGEHGDLISITFYVWDRGYAGNRALTIKAL
jgi:hypothetical protein